MVKERLWEQDAIKRRKLLHLDKEGRGKLAVMRLPVLEREISEDKTVHGFEVYHWRRFTRAQREALEWLFERALGTDSKHVYFDDDLEFRVNTWRSLAALGLVEKQAGGSWHIVQLTASGERLMRQLLLEYGLDVCWYAMTRKECVARLLGTADG